MSLILVARIIVGLLLLVGAFEGIHRMAPRYANRWFTFLLVVKGLAVSFAFIGAVVLVMLAIGFVFGMPLTS